MERSLFDELGGRAAVNSAAIIFYQKILTEKCLRRFFSGKDPEWVKATQQAFLGLAFGQPSDYACPRVRAAQTALFEDALCVGDLEVVVSLLDQTLAELGVPDVLIADSIALAESTCEDFIAGNKPKLDEAA